MGKLSRRSFLKGLGLVISTLPLSKFQKPLTVETEHLPGPPTPEPETEPISLQEEYNQRVEELADNAFREVRPLMHGSCSDCCCVGDPGFDWVTVWPTYDQASLFRMTRMLEPPSQYPIAVQSSAGFWPGDRLVFHTPHGPVDGPVVEGVVPGALLVSTESPNRSET